MPIDIGPVQLLVFAFNKPHFGGGISAELQRLKEQGHIRVIDALVVHKSAEGDVRTIQATDLSPEQAQGMGAIIGGLIGLGAGGSAGLEAGAQAGAETVREQGGHIFDPDKTWDVIEDIPPDTAAALLLLEHRWAIPLRDAIRAEGGMGIGDIWLHPVDLLDVGLISAEVAEELQKEAA
jgi:uncharacterized membrane protein